MSRARNGLAASRGGALAVAVLALLALAGGNTRARAADPVKLDFAGSITWFGQVPIMVAVDKGYFKDGDRRHHPGDPELRRPHHGAHRGLGRL
jgi:ABC-type nitrate/sulfonate/bicarbonate transport system substrate-binding protein